MHVFVKSISVSTLLILLISCNDGPVVFENDNNVVPISKNYPNVDQALWTYFEEFEDQAALRGIRIDLNAEDLSGDIQTINDDGVAGTCLFGPHITNEVTIDTDFWNNSNRNWREFVVFHELGHCVLNRSHFEAQDQNGTCISIMASGTGSCVSRYNNVSRSQYLDELFLNL